MPRITLPNVLQKYNFIPLELSPSLTSGYLHSTDFIQAIPVINGMMLFNESDLFFKDVVEERVRKLTTELIATAPHYQQFIRQKARRPVYDIYACFQPFNEATKSLYPFLNLLKKHLKKGDTILNLWDRTGWLGVLLAGFFPEQQVINIWEGNKDVLGYLWHEISLQYILWGTFHGLGIAVWHRYDRSNLAKLLRRYKLGHPIIASLLTFHFVVLSFTLIKEDNLQNAWQILNQLF